MVYKKLSGFVSAVSVFLILLLACAAKADGEACPVCGNESADCWIDGQGAVYCRNELIQYPADSLDTFYAVDKRCTAIGEGAFSQNQRLKSVVLQNGVSIINRSAFACTNIENVDLPESLLIIADLAFMNCHQLKSVILPSKLYAIGYDAFVECPLSTIRIPASVQFIDSEAFSKTAVNNVYFEGDSFFTADAPFRNRDHQQIVFHFPPFCAEEENPRIERMLGFYDRLEADYSVLFDVETDD